MKDVPIFLLLLIAAAGCSPQEAGPGTAGNDVELLLTWFEGEFSNRQQVEQDGAKPRHLFVSRVQMPQVPGETLYLEWHSGDAEGPIDSQRIWAFNGTDAGIEMRFYSLEATADDVLSGLRSSEDADATAIATLTLEDLYDYPEECIFLLRRDGELFSGKNGTGDCRIFNRAIERMMVPDVTLRISPDAIVEDAVYTYEPADVEPASEAVLQEFVRVTPR